MTPNNSVVVILKPYTRKIGLVLWLSVRTGALCALATQDFDQLVYAIYERYEGEVAYNSLQEHLWEYYHTPLALNKASREELQALCILTEVQIDQLFQYIAQHGVLVSIYELQAIPKFDATTLQLLCPFVRIAATPIDNVQRSGNRDGYACTRYERTLEPKRGYQHNAKKNNIPYTGSPDKFLTQISIKDPNGWTLGLSAQKGAGEALVWDPSKQYYGLMLRRLHWSWTGSELLKTLLIGDYAVGYGQGIILNSGFTMGKSSEAIKVIRTTNRGIRPHTAITTAAFRGLAATWKWWRLELTTYYSHLDLDGTIKNNRCVSSVSRGGYYRTQGEIGRKGNVNERVTGGTLAYKNPTQHTELGINLLHSHYSVPVDPERQKRNPYCFRGQQHGSVSLFYRYLWKNLHFFGEGALAKHGAKAAICGVVASWSRYIDTTLLWRHYNPNFYSLYGKSFRENTNGNEQGVYIAARINPCRHLYLTTCYDHFRVSSGLDDLNPGHSGLARIAYQFTKTSLLTLQGKTTTKVHNRISGGNADTVYTQQHYKMSWQYAPNQAIQLKSELLGNRYQQLDTTTRGYAGVQDIIYSIRHYRLKVRTALFHAPHSHNKLYIYTPNVAHTGFNFRPYQGTGIHGCLLMRYQPMANFRLELRYALTYRIDQGVIGSGYEAIQGNYRNDITLQVKWKLG